MNNREQLEEAVNLALQGQWDAAHQLVQHLEGETAAWIHAVLHKIEGDTSNSQYWYRRANRPYTDQDPQLELASIRDTLG